MSLDSSKAWPWAKGRGIKGQAPNPPPTPLPRPKSPELPPPWAPEVYLAGEKDKKIRRIALDFDGVLHSFVNGFTGDIPFDPPTPGAVEFVTWLLQEGWEVIIFSARARTESGREGIWGWLRHHKFPWTFPDPPAGCAVPRVIVTSTKCDCDVYVDDRGFRFTGSFYDVQQFITSNKLVPWHK